MTLYRRRTSREFKDELGHQRTPPTVPRLAGPYLSDLERGQQSPTLDVVSRLARTLRVTMSEIFATLNDSYRVQFRKRQSDAEGTL